MTGVLSASREHASAVAQLHKQLNREAPTTRDGVYSEESPLPSDAPKTNGSIFKALLGSKFKDLHTMEQLAVSVASGKPLDDRELLLEKVVQWLSSCPPDSPLAAKAGGAFISMLWNDMEHPPQTLLGKEYRFRQPDGSKNNPWQPDVGKAGLPYARTVSNKHPNPMHMLPDPSEIFDRVMKRREGSFEAHPGGLSGLFTAFATTVIHSIFRTQRVGKDGKPGDLSINETSGFVDLSIVYGHTAELVDKVRTGKNGLIHPDVVAEDRLWALPPAVIALCILFSRNHNVIATKLLLINERGHFGDWDKLSEEQRKIQDDELFETARLINVGVYAQVVLHDYLRSILGLVSTESTWVLDPRDPNATAPTGGGNHTSIEFNFLYRWHATISADDEKYSERWLRTFLPEDRKDAPISSLDEKDFAGVFARAGQALGPDPRTYEHLELKRGPDGRFNDDDLARVLMNAHEAPAHAFGSRSTPDIMRGVEIMGMTFARNVWKTCTFNEFRKYLNLKPVESFQEFSKDPDVALAFEEFYGHPDNIELYAGLICEATKEPMVGAGLCPGYTQSRAILSDAVALVRGDRFLTSGYDAGSLTAWGLESTMSSGDNGSYGGMLPGLFHATLPNSFRFNSVVANFPLQTPESMKKNLEALGIANKYDFTRPEPLKDWQYITEPAAIDAILDNHECFNVPYQHNISTFSLNPEKTPFAMGTDNKELHDRSRKIIEQLFYHENWEEPVSEYFIEKMRTILRRASYQVEGDVMAVDIIRDVINRVWIFYYADLIGVPLKTSDGKGLITPHEFYLVLTGLFSYTAIDFDPAHSWHLKETSMKSTKLLRTIIQTRMREVAAFGGIATAIGRVRKSVGGHPSGRLGSMNPLAVNLYTRANKLMKTHGYTHDEITNAIFGMTVASTTQPQDVMSQLVDFYLEKPQIKHLTRLTELCSGNFNKEVSNELLGYYYEAMRLTHATQGGPRYCVKAATVVVKGTPHYFEPGDRLLVDFKQLHGADVVDRFPQTVDPTRPRSQYRVLGRGLHNCVAYPIVLHTAPIVMREIFRLNISRSPGPAGQLKKFKAPFGKSGAMIQAYIDSTSMPFPFPQHLLIRYRLTGGAKPTVNGAVNGVKHEDE